MNGTCEVCGAPAECTHHLIFGNSMRRLADQDNLTIELCNKCHNMAGLTDCKIHDNPMAEKLSKMLGQVLWEKRYIAEMHNYASFGRTSETATIQAHREFMKRYGRSYIDGI